jgi:hypothetical protein
MIIKLLPSHKPLVKKLFDNAAHYEIFSSTYLSDLNNFHSYGLLENDELKSFMSYYESDEDLSWYITSHNFDENILAEIIKQNEYNNRLKFYVLRTQNSVWNSYINDRYFFVDEIFVPSKTKCNFTNYWELLFNRNLSEFDSIVRCYLLKQEHRGINDNFAHNT